MLFQQNRHHRSSAHSEAPRGSFQRFVLLTTLFYFSDVYPLPLMRRPKIQLDNLAALNVEVAALFIFLAALQRQLARGWEESYGRCHRGCTSSLLWGESLGAGHDLHTLEHPALALVIDRLYGGGHQGGPYSRFERFDCYLYLIWYVEHKYASCVSSHADTPGHFNLWRFTGKSSNILETNTCSIIWMICRSLPCENSLIIVCFGVRACIIMSVVSCDSSGITKVQLHAFYLCIHCAFFHNFTNLS